MFTSANYYYLLRKTMAYDTQGVRQRHISSVFEIVIIDNIGRLSDFHRLLHRVVLDGIMT